MVILVPLGLAFVPALRITEADSVTCVEPSSVISENETGPKS